MNKYNDKLANLITEANEDGYIYEDNTFKKIKKDKVDVIHLYAVSNINSEMKVYNKCLVILDEYILSKIKAISTISEVINFMKYYLYIIDGREVSKIEKFKSLEEKDLFNVDIMHKENIYNEKTYIEASFKQGNSLFGFLHIFKCPFKALDSFQNIKYYFKQSL